MKVGDRLGEIQTRGDFRDMSESYAQRSNEQQQAVDRLVPLWAAMAAAWGQFANQYGEEPNASWIYELKDYTEAQLMQGYQRAVAAGTDFPPNLSVFVAHVRNKGAWEHARQAREYQPERLIEDKGAKSRRAEAAEEGIQNLKDILDI